MVNLVAVYLRVMRLAAYLFALGSSAFVYLLFAAYLSVAAGLSSWLPLLSLYCALLVFGLLSWLHFFLPRSGTILLVVMLTAMYISFPLRLLVGYFEKEAMIGPIESIVPLLLVLTTSILAALAYNAPVKLAMRLKVSLAVAPALLAGYCGFHFTVRYFGLM